jgi:hypothetical protein
MRITPFIAVAALAAGACIAVPTAGATGAVGGGVLRIHGSGSVYAQPGATVTGVTTAGGTVTYAVEVANSGTDLAQFNVRLSSANVGETVSLTSGSLATTPLATAPRGYFTTPLAPGKAEALKLKVKMPASASQTTRSFIGVYLYDTDGGFLSNVAAETEVRATAGPFAADSYVSGNTGGPVISEPGQFSADYAAQPIKPGHSASYTVKVQNDGPTTAALRLDVGEFLPCDDPANGYFPVTVKVGTADITPAAVNGTYTTAPLAHGKSVTLKVSVGYPATPPASCGSDQVAFVVFGPNNTASEANLLTLLAA